MVDRGKLGTVAAGELLLLSLRRRWRVAPLPGRSQLGSGRLGRGSAAPAVVTDVVHRGVVNDRSAVDVSDVCPAYVIDCAVVVEEAIVPIAARIANSEVAEAIVNATIESDRWSPVAGIPAKPAVVPAPVTRGPKRAHEGRQHPCTRHPVVTVNRVPCPVTWCPDVARTRANRLRIHG